MGSLQSASRSGYKVNPEPKRPTRERELEVVREAKSVELRLRQTGKLTEAPLTVAAAITTAPVLELSRPERSRILGGGQEKGEAPLQMGGVKPQAAEALIGGMTVSVAGQTRGGGTIRRRVVFCETGNPLPKADAASSAAWRDIDSTTVTPGGSGFKKFPIRSTFVLRATEDSTVLETVKRLKGPIGMCLMNPGRPWQQS